ncbi:hypothetical protein ABZZ17_36685 [Streptomyces sp. NPDC006512]|uniref:hypothetical protein n=1 Tax=Streptomyces sp. NPDC006512 TaxID=3154307 RepID=UPI00339E619D
MTTNENTSPLEGDIRPLDNHASGTEIKPPVPPVEPPADPAQAGQTAGEDIVTLDNHASGPRP